ncbi:hypothetical protein [Luteolibacter marinus]|uniref:hypothetical protein n=1 Tax=Luteolibacter marinus TaxID=2776705 RepID=UPI0018689EDD|nr:hypothetical protein [Luteolibacter marinus]
MIDLNNRELAAATFILAVIAYCLTNPKVRPSIFALVKCALNWKLAFTALACWGVVAAGIWVLKAVGLWNETLLKDAVIWSIYSGTSIAFRGVNELDPNAKFKALAMDQIKGVIVFEFLVNVYTMSYSMELIWLLLMILVTVLIAVGETDEKNRLAVGFFRFVQGSLGFWMLLFVVHSLWRGRGELLGLQALQAFVLPIFLAILMIPFGYLVSLIAGYEALFIRLKLGRRQPLDLRLYSQFKLIELGGLNSSRLRRMGKLLGPRTSWPNDHDQVDHLFVALGQTMRDPLLDEAGDFVWPPEQAWSIGPVIESMKEYRNLVDPLIGKLVDLENSAVQLMSKCLADEQLRSDMMDGMRSRLTEMEGTIEIAISFPDLAPRVRKLDRRFQDYAASVDDLYRMAIRTDDKEWESWRATVEMYSEWCCEARERMEIAILQYD